MTRRWPAIALAIGGPLAALAFACSSMSEVNLGDSPGRPKQDARGVVLVHAAAFSSFRLCFEAYPELRPQPDSKIMPNANVVGVEVGSAIRIEPLSRAPGRVFVIDRGQVEPAPGASEPTCGTLICDQEAGPAEGCLRRGLDYDEIAPIDKALGVDRVELLAIAGCANSLVLQNLGVESSICGETWQPLTGNLTAKVLALSAELASPDLGLPVQVVHLAPMLETARGKGSLEISFGPLGEPAPGRPIAKNPPLFAAAQQQTLAVDREDPSFYGAFGFRIALSGSDDGGLDAGTSIVVAQSLAEIQDLSAPRDVPAEYYRAASNYVLLLLGDPSIAKTLDDGGANPIYNARRGLHLLTLPILDPAATDGGNDGSATDGASGDRR